MNILIVDDEELTREGLLSSINWRALGIDKIYQADDGLNGYALAQKHQPEIILSDIRMPRLNGVEMADRIRKENPECHIIFMSGYSDKEYLKAAIRLKAVSYVEKPILPSEIEESVRQAIVSHKMLELNKDSAARRLMDDSAHLALIMTNINSKNDPCLTDKLKSLGFAIKPSTLFTTVLIKIVDRFLPLDLSEDNPLGVEAKNIIHQHHFQYLWGIKQGEYILLHLFTNAKLPEENLSLLAQKLAKILCRAGNFYISLGQTYTGIEHVYDSYYSAVLLLQSAFFYDYNQILHYAKNTTQSPEISSNLLLHFMEALTANDQIKAINMINQLYTSLIGNQNMLANYVKDIYYKLFMEIFKAAGQKRVHLADTDEESQTILDYVSRSGNLTTLNNLLLQKLNLLFLNRANQVQENSTIFLIKSFISQNFQKETLSVKDISEHVFLSPSYVCTLFKNETGKTLNQYLTEYRIEKAKILLLDSRYKITDISSRVGYCDGNYFSKSFKKLVGYSPSEYRELKNQ